jgi:hypothetical protein
LFVGFVFDGQHGVSHLTAQSRHVHFRIELAGVKNHKVWHGVLANITNVN